MKNTLFRATDIGPLYILDTPGFERTNGTLYTNSTNYYEWDSLDNDGYIVVRIITSE